MHFLGQTSLPHLPLLKFRSQMLLQGREFVLVVLSAAPAFHIPARPITWLKTLTVLL